MKKLFLVLLLVVFVVAVGCEVSTEADTNAEADTETEIEDDSMEAETTSEVEADVDVDVKVDGEMIEDMIEQTDGIDEDIDTTKTMADENVEVTTTVSDGKVENEVVVKTENPAGDTDMALSEWCIAGETYTFEEEGGSSNTVIEGTASYKGSEWCKGVSTTEIQGMTIDTTYYFTYGGKEMWVISNVAGVESETHIVNE